jgi:CubicO group peptidase (beta-lactamase class C family)
MLLPQFETAPVSSILSDTLESVDHSGPTDPAELEAFLDAFIPAQAEMYQIPGTTVAVVKDGEIFLAKGYGYADVKSQTPVVADKTLFHIGSVTKLLTWTAVMQLFEQGKLDLHADVNRYLPPDVQIPDTYAQPITLHHLMTHTPGFEDRLGNIFRFGKNDAVPLDTYVAQQMPTRVYPPGEIIGYSNYGAALAGYIIEQVSGMSYEQYIEENILDPLDMDRSSIRQPVPPELADDLALGHLQTPLGVRPFMEYFPSAPVVGLSATATDMAKFMIAHLQDGRYRDTRILHPATAQLMHQQQFTQDPRIIGVTYGFVEWERNGQRLLWHGGSTGLFQSTVVLLPEHNLGFFVGCNRKSAREAGKEFRQAFLDHYFPFTPPDPQPLLNHVNMSGYQARLDRFAGVYKESRWTYTKADKLVYAFARLHEITTDSDGKLNLLGARYVQVEPLVFQEVDGQTTLIFEEDEHGNITRAFYDFDPHKVLIKVAWYETRDFHLVVLATCIIIFLSASVSPTTIRWVGALNLLYPLGMFIISLTTFIQPLPNLSFLAPLLVIALVLALGLSLVLAFFAWRGGSANDVREDNGGSHYVWQSIHYTLVSLAALAFMVWLYYWNLLGLWQF